MRIPDRVRVMGRDYTVTIGLRDQELRDQNLWGEANHRDGTINIRGDLAQDQQEETFLHEIMHTVEIAVLDDKGLQESTIKAMSRGIYAVFRDNGWWPQ